ncbi:MAG: trigger factor [Actinomycetota bacterium]|nr:trigger factor [Actinomycetota bacterium]
MKSAVETLNPTRVRLTVEVPYEELESSLAAAYKKIGSQVQLPGFRKGKVPARLIDQRFGRAVVLEEAVNDALPKFYGQAVEENDIQVLGSPEVDVTEVPDPQAGGELKFTAEVDVRPTIELPSYDDLRVTVDDVEVTDEDVEEQLQGLRERFGVLRGVDRPAADGDFLSLDLAASVDGEALPDATAKGLSYQVGSGALLEGLDEAVMGLSEGETATFATTLVGGEHAGREAQVEVTVRSVKERDLPELDDDFAQTASEFDTVDELRADVRSRLGQMKLLEQGASARDKALEALLERVDVPLPEGVVRGEVEGRMHSLTHQLENAGLTKESYLASEGRSEEDFDAEVEQRSRDSIKAQFVLDAIADKEQLQVNEQELSEHVVRRASRLGMSPDEFAQQIVQAGQVPQLVSEVVRAKALAVVLEKATVVDASGRPVDLDALEPQLRASEEEYDETDALEDGAGDARGVDPASAEDEVAAGSGQSS